MLDKCTSSVSRSTPKRFAHISYVSNSLGILSLQQAKGSTLTDGARAMSKHVNRSSDSYWGSFSGSG